MKNWNKIIAPKVEMSMNELVKTKSSNIEGYFEIIEKLTCSKIIKNDNNISIFM